MTVPLTQAELQDLMFRLGVRVARPGVIHINPACHLITGTEETERLGLMLTAVAAANRIEDPS